MNEKDALNHRLEVDLTGAEMTELAQHLDEPGERVFEKMLWKILEKNRDRLETCEPEEFQKLQGDCKRIRLMLRLRKNVLDAHNSNGRS